MSLATAMALLAAGASTVASKPEQSDALTEIRADIARLDLTAAAAKYNAEVTVRLPLAQAGKPDPLLDRMMVEYSAGFGNLRANSSILDRIVASPISGDGDRYRLFQAKAAEDLGEFGKAAKLYRAIIADARATADEKLTAQLGLARQQMLADPGAAVRTLTGIDKTQVAKKRAWEVDLLEGRSEALVDGDTAAAPALKRAWAEALDAGPGSAAPARIAGDIAFAAARAGDRSAYLNMLAVDRFHRESYYNEAALMAGLPICGEAGVRPDDRAIVEVFYRLGMGIPQVSLLWASRSGIGNVFLAAAANMPMPGQSDGQVLHFTLGCRTAPAPDYQARGSIDDETNAWMTGQGAYPLLGSSANNDLFNLVSELSSREAKYGKDSILLLPALIRIEPVVMSMADAQSKDSGKRAQEITGRVRAILVDHGAPPELVFGSRLAMLLASVMAQATTNDKAADEAGHLMLDAAQEPSTSLDMVYALAQMAGSTNVPSELKERVLRASADLFRQRVGARDPRTNALVLKLAGLESDKGDKAAAASLRASLGLNRGLCTMTDPPPRFSSSNIAAGDYPPDLIFANITGHTTLEFDIDEMGGATGSRVILSDPPYAFDAIARDRASTIHYDVGNSRPCRAMVQNVTWQLTG